MVDKEINNNGIEFIDFGLPSGTLWATANVGAQKPSDFGMYFKWGSTKDFSKDLGTDYEWGKYATPNATLDLEDDAAHIIMGGSWHIPTPTQFQELIDNTISKWTKQGGVDGRLFISKKEPSKSIFIPAAGYAWNGSLYDVGDCGSVWSSTLDTGYVGSGQGLYFRSYGVSLDGSYRYYGFSVRGVLG